MNPRAGGVFEEAKLCEVRKYLSEQFPTCPVRESYAFDKAAQEFCIVGLERPASCCNHRKGVAYGQKCRPNCAAYCIVGIGKDCQARRISQ